MENNKQENPQKPVVVYGVVNIGCDQTGATFQTLVATPDGNKTVDADSEEVFVPCELKFFNQAVFGSEEKQPQLIELLNQAAANIDVGSGRDWFAMYAAYRYYQDQRGVKGGYTDFFTDIEHLLPNTLTKIKVDKGGEKRYHSYTMLMGREADAWYMDKGKLPLINELTTYKAHFEGDWSRFEKSCKIIIETYKKFKQI